MENRIGKLLGSGGTSNVYEFDDNKVIKIYKPHVNDNVIHSEKYIGELLNKLTLDIPKLIGSINIKDKQALIYERVQGEIFAQPLLEGCYNKQMAYQYAQMHYEIHKKRVTELPSLHEMLKCRILTLQDQLEGKVRSKQDNIQEGTMTSLLRLLDQIPNGQSLCHGDFQPLNIIGQQNEYRAIDWNGACSGNPILDVAWSYMTLLSPAVEHLLSDSIAHVFREFNEDYLQYYCDMSGLYRQQIIDCLPIVAARRLFDNVCNDNGIGNLEMEWLHHLIESVYL